MGIIFNEIVTNQQFTCPHCQNVSPIIGKANVTIQGHCDWVSCINCNMSSRDNVIMKTQCPLKIKKQYTYTSDGEVISCFVVSVTPMQ